MLPDVLRFLTRSIRGRITLLVAAVLLPAGALAFWLIFGAYRNERRAVEGHLTSAVRALTSIVEGELRERQALLYGLSTSPHLESGDFAAFRAQAQRLLRSGDEWVVLMRPDGQQLVNTYLPPDHALPKLELPDGFWRALSNGLSHVSDASESAASGQTVVRVSIPVVARGQLRYVLSVAVRSPLLSEPLIQESWAPGWLVTVVDRSGTIVARNRQEHEFVGRPASANFRQRIAGADEGVLESTTLDGVASITAFYRSSELGWTVVVAAPRHEVLAGPRQMLVVTLTAATLLGLCATGLATWVGRGVVKGVHRLVVATEALGNGEPAPAARTGIDETDFVARALAESARRLAAREQDLRQSEAEIARARDEALAASRAKDDFLAALSHELRTPLSPVLLLATDAARNPAYADAAREAFAMIARNVELEARLIDDLLDLTRIARGKMTFDQRVLDLHDVLRDAVRTIEAELKENDVALELQLAASRTGVMADPIRLQQVFWNLLKNAVKFTPAGGRILVQTTVDPAGNSIVARIEDSGVGMTATELGRIFQPFSQGDHAAPGGARRFGGLGLGLAISRMLVDLHAGRIEADSPGPGQGAVFTVTLPLARVRPQSPAPEPDGPGEPAAPTPSLRILLVEDHDPTRQALEQILVRRGHEVTTADSVQAALDAAAGKAFSLVLSDIGLPDGEGYGLMEALRERHGLVGIALTGYGSEDDVERARAAGFVAHLTKPVTAAALDRTLAQVTSPAA